ncbi:hypothetical protein [Brasilonema sp. UFV-L1]|uniref:hypothetical protein n=1 Tax=Brasilonema sp. UFV-L1 TaxID=2234130 RepID=UPI0030D90227
MKSSINSMNNMHWNRIFTLALPISILLFAQACAPRRLISSTQSNVDSPVNYPLKHSGN